MRTEDLITALAADQRPRVTPGRALAAALAAGAVVSLALLLAILGIRPDFATAIGTWRFDTKLAIVCLALALGASDTVRLARPQARGFASRANLVLPALLGIALCVELIQLPSDVWAKTMIGTNALVCLAAIPLLALPPLFFGLIAMRDGAPSSPTLAGASVGRLAAGLAASLYALHCFDDSPLFVSVWYFLATLPVIALGALAGRKLLRW